MDFDSRPHDPWSSERCKIPESPSAPSDLTDDDLNNTAIPWEYAEKALRRKADVLELASALLLRILLVVTFAFFLFPFTNASARFDMFGSIAYPLLQSEIAKFKDSFFFRDAATPAQYGDFLMDVVLPTLADYKASLGPNLVLGALRLRTQRVLPKSCKLHSSVVLRGVDESLQACYGPLSGAFEDTGVDDSLYNHEKSWQYSTCKQLGGVTLRGHLGSYHCGGYYFDVPLWTPNANITDPKSCTFESCDSDPELQYLFANPEYIKTSLSDLQSVYVGPRLSSGTPFIDDVATRFVVTELAVYNPTLHIFLLVKLYAESGPGGSWKTSTSFNFLTVWDETLRGYNGYAVFFFVYLVANVVWFGVQQARRMRRSGFMASALNLWTLVDVGIYALLIVSCSFRFAFFAQTRAAHVRLANITYKGEYPTQLDVLAAKQNPRLYVDGVVTVLLFFSLLPYLGVEQRVKRVINSFLHYRNALTGVVLVSLLLFTAFALSGHRLVSSQLWDFRSVDAAFRTLFFIHMRQVDVNEIASAPGNRVEKIFFMYAAILVCFYIVIGAICGVVHQGLEDTLQTEPSTEPMWWVWRRWRLVVASPRQWLRRLTDLVRGRSEADRLYKASLTLQRYRKAKYAVVLHVKEKRDHYVTHQDWQLAFVDALEPIFGAHPHRNQRVGTPDTGQRSVRVDGACADDPIGRRQRHDRSPTTAFPPFLDDLDTSTRDSTAPSTSLSASQEEAIRAHLEWVEMTWRDLVFEYLRTQDLSETARRIKKEIEWMACGVKDVIGEHLDLLTQFPARLASLERQIAVLSNELVPISLTSKVLASSNKTDTEEDEDDANTPSPAAPGPRDQSPAADPR